MSRRPAAADPRSDDAPPPILYIGGWGRSGSTLLDRLLGELPGFVSVGELREVWRRGCVENRMCGCGSPFHDCAFWVAVGARAFGGWEHVDAPQMVRDWRLVDRIWTMPLLLSGWEPRRFAAAARRFREQLVPLYRAVASAGAARVVVDSSKLPNYAALLGSAGFDVRLAHLVRDSRGVAFSWQKRVRRSDATGEGADEMLRYGPLGASFRYVGYNLATQLLPRRRFPYLRARYEDLVADPVPVLRAVSRLVDEPAEPGLFERFSGRTVEVGVQHTVDGNPSRLARGPIALGLDDAWHRDLAARQRRAVTALTFPLLAAYGYLGGRGR